MVDEQTTEELPQETGMAERPRWLFWSTRNSIEHDVPSIAAIIETALAVPLFWWLAGHVGFYLPLLVSMVIAPFVLLRSDESVKLGLRWFLKWHERKGTFRVVPPSHEVMPASVFVTRLVISVASGLLSMLAIRWALNDILLTFRAAPWLYVLLAIWSANFILNLAFLNLSAFACLFVRRLSEVWLSGRGPIAILIDRVVSGLVLGATIGMALVLAGITTVSVATFVGFTVGLFKAVAAPLRDRLWDRFPEVANVMFTPLLILDLPAVFAYALFIFVETAIIRMVATAVYLHYGLEALPRNFRRLVICTSPTQVPELIPGLHGNETKLHWFTFSGSLSTIASIRRSVGMYWTVQTVLQTTLIFLPAWLYRISLKSTFWFWWPLTLLGGEVRYARDPGLYHERVVKSLWGVTGIVLSLLTVIAFIFTNLIATGGIFHPNPLLNAMGYVFLIDWSAPPWQLLSLASALLSLFIILRLDYVFREYRYAVDHGREEIRSKTDRKFFIVELAARVRFILFLAFWVIVGGHTFLYLNSLDCWVSKIPNSIEEVGRMVYGKRMPPLTCRLLCRTTVPELILSIPLLMGIRMDQP